MEQSKTKNDEITKIVVYSDGSSDGKSGGLGGWAFVVIINGNKTYESNGSQIKATNNSVEILGATEGLKYIDQLITNQDPIVGALREVILRSDSQLVLGYATGRYQCKAMHLLPLMLQLRKMFRKLNAKDEWVRGHSGDKYNDECDRLAKKAREDAGIAKVVNNSKKDTD